MITVNIKDGLGNQMFQFATAYALAKKNGTSVKCHGKNIFADVCKDNTYCI